MVYICVKDSSSLQIFFMQSDIPSVYFHYNPKNCQHHFVENKHIRHFPQIYGKCRIFRGQTPEKEGVSARQGSNILPHQDAETDAHIVEAVVGIQNIKPLDSRRLTRFQLIEERRNHDGWSRYPILCTADEIEIAVLQVLIGGQEGHFLQHQIFMPERISSRRRPLYLQTGLLSTHLFNVLY